MITSADSRIFLASAAVIEPCLSSFRQISSRASVAVKPSMDSKIVIRFMFPPGIVDVFASGAVVVVIWLSYIKNRYHVSMEPNKGGRPPLENPKARPRQIRFTEQQDKYIAAEAEKENVSFAEYVRARALPKRLQ